LNWAQTIGTSISAPESSETPGNGQGREEWA
jgi:hypothetical protein